MHRPRNHFFTSSGFTKEEKRSILARKSKIKKLLKQQKRQKRIEQKHITIHKFRQNSIKKPKKNKLIKRQQQIQNGFKISAWWNKICEKCGISLNQNDNGYYCSNQNCTLYNKIIKK